MRLFTATFGQTVFGANLQAALLVMAPVLKGRAHPAEHGHEPEADAISYGPLCRNPTPRRPREVICELLNFQVPLQVATHVGLGESFLLDKDFLKTTKILVHHARQGHMPDHLATARQLKLAGAEGNIRAIQLYRWGREARTPAYRTHIAQRRKMAEISQQAPAVPSTEDQATLQTHKRLRSV